jgi:hypothetical protein
MDRQDEIAAIEEYLTASQVSRCQTAYVAPMSAPPMSRAEEAIRLGKVAAPSPV